MKCIVEGEYKLIWSSNGAHELYRIAADPGEEENVIGKEEERARSLDQVLKAWELVTRRRQLFEGATARVQEGNGWAFRESRRTVAGSVCCA